MKRLALITLTCLTASNAMAADNDFKAGDWLLRPRRWRVAGCKQLAFHWRYTMSLTTSFM
jgi:hypothetical protein